MCTHACLCVRESESQLIDTHTHTHDARLHVPARLQWCTCACVCVRVCVCVHTQMALAAFKKLHAMLPDNYEVLWQIATCYDMDRDFKQVCVCACVCVCVCVCTTSGAFFVCAWTQPQAQQTMKPLLKQRSVQGMSCVCVCVCVGCQVVRDAQ